MEQLDSKKDIYINHLNKTYSSFEFKFIEQYIKFINFLNDLCNKFKNNQWVMIIWNFNNQIDILSNTHSVCVINEEHLTIFMNWLIENHEFIWNDSNTIKTGVDVLQEITFIYHSNPLYIHQYFMSYKQTNKSVLHPYTFLNFIEEIALERYNINSNHINENDINEDDINENDINENDINEDDINENDINLDIYINEDDNILYDLDYNLDEINKIVNVKILNK